MHRRSGMLMEYYEEFWISLGVGDFEEKLEELRQSCSEFAGRVKRYPRMALRMSNQNFKVFVELLDPERRFSNNGGGSEAQRVWCVHYSQRRTSVFRTFH